MVWLKQAVASGYNNVAHIKADPALDTLRDRQDFKKLVAGFEDGPAGKKAKP